MGKYAIKPSTKKISNILAIWQGAIWKNATTHYSLANAVAISLALVVHQNSIKTKFQYFLLRLEGYLKIKIPKIKENLRFNPSLFWVVNNMIMMGLNFVYNALKKSLNSKGFQEHKSKYHLNIEKMFFSNKIVCSLPNTQKKFARDHSHYISKRHFCITEIYSFLQNIVICFECYW